MRALRPLRVLILEKCQDDARLLLHNRCHAVHQLVGERVQTENDIRAFLDPPAPALAPSLTPCPGKISGSRSLKILLVQDNRDTLLYLAWELGQHRHTLRTAANVTAARTLAASKEFDLLICDIELPDGTGQDLMREIKRARNFPGVAISGLSSGDGRRQSQTAELVAHLPKPIRFQTLEVMIHRVVSADVPARPVADLLNDGTRMIETSVRLGA